MAAGRKTKYKDSMPDMIRAFPPEKSSLDCIAAACGVTVKTVCEWQNTKREFRDAIKALRASTIRAVENALIKRAVGYEYTETKTYQDVGKDGVVTKQHVEKIKRAEAPHPTAMIFFLKNKLPDQYKNDPPPVVGNEKAEIIRTPLPVPGGKRKKK